MNSLRKQLKALASSSSSNFSSSNSSVVSTNSDYHTMAERPLVTDISSVKSYRNDEEDQEDLDPLVILAIANSEGPPRRTRSCNDLGSLTAGGSTHSKTKPRRRHRERRSASRTSASATRDSAGEAAAPFRRSSTSPTDWQKNVFMPSSTRATGRSSLKNQTSTRERSNSSHSRRHRSRSGSARKVRTLDSNKMEEGEARAGSPRPNSDQRRRSRSNSTRKMRILDTNEEATPVSPKSRRRSGSARSLRSSLNSKEEDSRSSPPFLQIGDTGGVFVLGDNNANSDQTRSNNSQNKTAKSRRRRVSDSQTILKESNSETGMASKTTGRRRKSEGHLKSSRSDGSLVRSRSSSSRSSRGSSMANEKWEAKSSSTRKTTAAAAPGRITRRVSRRERVEMVLSSANADSLRNLQAALEPKGAITRSRTTTVQDRELASKLVPQQPALRRTRTAPTAVRVRTTPKQEEADDSNCNSPTPAPSNSGGLASSLLPREALKGPVNPWIAQLRPNPNEVMGGAGPVVANSA